VKLSVVYTRSYLPGRKPSTGPLHYPDLARYPETKWIRAARGFEAGLTDNPGHILLCARETDAKLGYMSMYNPVASRLLGRRFCGLAYVQLTDPVQMDAWLIRGFDEFAKRVNEGDAELDEQIKGLSFVSAQDEWGVTGFYMVKPTAGRQHDKKFLFLKLKFG
jgi:hypothetical protein